MATIAALLASYHVFVHELTPLMVIAFLLLGYEGSRPRAGILGNRHATALLSLFAAIFGVGWLVFHFHAFSVEVPVLHPNGLAHSGTLDLRKPAPLACEPRQTVIGCLRVSNHFFDHGLAPGF